jgi:hypothetical protein
VVDFARGIAHFLEAREQFVPQHGSSLTIFVMTVTEHKATAPSSVQCFIVTVSDTRTLDDDVSGRTIAELLTAAGHVVAGRTVVRDDPELVHSTIERHLADRGVQVIITNGGTGITSRDSTYGRSARSSKSGSTGSASCSACSLPGDRPGGDDDARLRRPRRPPHYHGAGISGGVKLAAGSW